MWISFSSHLNHTRGQYVAHVQLIAMKIRGGSRGRVQGVRTPCKNSAKKKTMLFIGVEVEQETSAPPPKKNPGSAPEDVLEKWQRGNENRKSQIGIN